MGIKILIIKLESAGDVLRTTPLLRSLKKRYPESFISWVVGKDAVSVLERNPYIDRLLIFNHLTTLRLLAEKFNLVLSLDKAVEAAALASLCQADEKLGYGLSKEGKIYPINHEAKYSFFSGLSNDLKFHINKKTYQQIIFELARIPYKNEEYIFHLSEEALTYVRNFFMANGINENDLVVGLNTGCGPTFENKKWTVEGFVGLADRLMMELRAKVILLGGPLEKERNKEIKRLIKGKVIHTGCDNNLDRFAAFINFCKILVTGDTVALHIAIALKRPVVAIFGPTCPQEIDLYGRGEKVVSKIECAPCYKNSCERIPNCMDLIEINQVFDAISRLSMEFKLEINSAKQQKLWEKIKIF
jgi:heptosyltransferase-2